MGDPAAQSAVALGVRWLLKKLVGPATFSNHLDLLGEPALEEFRVCKSLPNVFDRCVQDVNVSKVVGSVFPLFRRRSWQGSASAPIPRCSSRLSPSLASERSSRSGRPQPPSSFSLAP